ncbi:hypothetical protein DV737_g652, partial [Chaetothyriales sp. CBS 132003]
MAPPDSRIDSLDFDANATVRSARSHRSLLDDDVDLMDELAQSIIERDRRRMQREVLRSVSFICALLNCLCAGSIATFSLYGGALLTDLHYTQFRVNAVSVTAELAMYLPVPLFGYLCDRFSPRPLSLLSSLLFGAGYLLAAFVYKSGPPRDAGGHGWPFGVMVLAFVGIGAATSCMYLVAVAACAKNYAQSRYRGFMLAVPIAAFGISGLWQSQVGAQLLSKQQPNAATVTATGDVDVFKYFLFLAGTLAAAGIIGSIGLHIVDEEALIDRGIEDLERSGLLAESDFFQPRSRRTSYGTTSMWLLAAGFFLVTGPGEAYINNLGTIILSLTPTTWSDTGHPPAGRASTHVSLIALTSTIARLGTGSLSDIFAPPIQLLAFLFLAIPFFTPAHPRLFLLSSSLLGLGYGACFSLVPIIVSVVWGPENFATNWGIVAMMPAGGAAIWSIVYSVGYSRGSGPGNECFGSDCFSAWAWGCAASVAVAIALLACAWRTWTRGHVAV